MMTDKDKVRKAFEKWFVKYYPNEMEGLIVSASWAAYQAVLSARIPDGWQLVPVEPDMSMELSGQSILKDEFGYAQRQELVRLIYKAMIAAAPKPEGE